MKGIVTCQDCEFYITIYRFTGKQGLFNVPKKWCEECDILETIVRATIRDLGIGDKVKLTVKPWFLWFWQPLLTHLAWHAPILIINGKLVSQGIVPDKETLIKAFDQNPYSMNDRNPRVD
jgi:hypothetical protein